MQEILRYDLPMGNGFLTWIYSEMNHRGWRSADLARRGEMSDSTISRVFSGERLPKWDFCVGVARALDMRAEMVFRKAGLLPPLPPEVAEEEELVYLFRRLNLDRREAALNMMRGLVQGMTGHYTFIATDENALDAACFRAIMNLADEENGAEAIRKLQGNITRRQQLGIDRKLDRLDAGDEARCDAGAEPGGSRTS